MILKILPTLYPNILRISTWFQILNKDIRNLTAFIIIYVSYYAPNCLPFFVFENYNNLSEATSNLIDDIDSNHQSSFDFISGSDVLAAQHGTVSVRLLGSTFNILIAGITGGPLSSYVRRRGFSALAAALESRLAATIHSNQFGYLIKGSVGAMVKFADPGLYLAQVIDQHDKIRNNGWIEAW